MAKKKNKLKTNKIKQKNNLINKTKLIPYILVIILIFTNIWIYINATNSNTNKIKKEIKNKYKLLNPSQGFFNKEDLIVNIQPLREDLEKIGKNRKISIYFEYLNTGASISVNKDLAIWPGSLMKIPVAMAVMKKVEEGKWKISNELVLMEQDKSEQFGNLYTKPTGSRFTIEYLIEEMLINSDNTARTILLRNLDQNEIDDTLLHLGIEDIFNENQEVSAKKYSIFWRAFYAASYLSPENSQYILNLSSKLTFDKYLINGAPNNVKFSHKLGVNMKKNIYSDSGIFYIPDRPYILTVMMEGYKEKDMKAIMSDISKKAYNYVSNY